MDAPRYTDYNLLLKQQFALRVQKISINAGFTCPNRDGSISTGGCTYCNNQSFVPDYCAPHKSITQQLTEGIAFFHHKYQAQQYLAYFQSYTNTYADLSHLLSLYNEALSVPGVVGLVIGTRPDCVSNELLDALSQIARTHYVMIEYGIESTSDATLSFINRGHTYACAIDAITRTANRGIHIGVHIILGLPHESTPDIIIHAQRLSSLPIDSLKLHQLQIIRGTRMAEQYTSHPEWFHLFSADDYISLVINFLEHLNPAIAIERFVSSSPKEFLLAPDWGIKNYVFVDRIIKELKKRDTHQGRLFTKD